jgi:hypothetical protein
MTHAGVGQSSPSVRRTRSIPSVLSILSALVAFLLAFATPAFAQTTLSGVVHDPSGRVAVDVPVVAEDEVTGRRWETRSSDIGHYEFKQLPPGRYRIIVDLTPFNPHIVSVVIPAGRRATLDIALQLARAEQVTVQSDAPRAPEAMDGGGTTTFGQQAIEALPLTNGRTTQSLLTMVPGVVFTDSVGTLAQFTAVGQRRFANRLTIDGVSADLAVDTTGPGVGQAGSGSLPAMSTLGGTQTLVPLAAIEEIQVRTTNATPEYQRTPGAQTSIVTRAGGNRFSGAAFTDVRPHQLAASDWFANAGQAPRRDVQMWNGGASAGGPLVSKRLFYFASWERQQIDRPVTTTVNVPSVALRESAPANLRPLLDAFPLPNGPDTQPGLASLSRAFPVASRLSTVSGRVDARLSDRHRLFARINVGDSSGDQLTIDQQLPRYSFSQVESTNTKTATMGLTSVLSPFATNDLRVNVSSHSGEVLAGTSGLGDAQALPLSMLVPPGTSVENVVVGLQLFSATSGQIIAGRTAANAQRQWQLVDTLSWLRGRHQWQAGVDVRHVIASSDAAPDRYFYRFANVNQLLQGRVGPVTVEHFQPARVLLQNFAAFVQDAVRVSPRLSLNFGLRYSVKPAPSNLEAAQPLLIDYEALPELQTRPQGAALWKTSWGDVAPQVAATYQLRATPGREAVLRAGWGLSFDDLSNPGAAAFGSGYPYYSLRSVSSGTFPVPAALLTGPPIVPFAEGDLGQYYAFAGGLRSPRTYSWQAGIEQALGSTQRVGLTYVGAAGRDLVYWQGYYVDSLVVPINAYSNDASSDYHALTTEYTHRLSRGFQARVAYTWSHAIDVDSGESSSPNPPVTLIDPSTNRGSADFDRRHVLQATVSYRPPTPGGPRLLQTIFADWQIDAVITARSGAPVTVTIDRDLGYGLYTFRADVVPGVSQWISDSLAPGGQRLNPAAFEEPAEERQGTLGRNSLRASPLRQLDLGVSRSLRFGSRVVVQLRAEAFNVLNLPNFGSPESATELDNFGRAYESYANRMGTGTLVNGGLTPVLQTGGPRSMQFSVRLGW